MGNKQARPKDDADLEGFKIDEALKAPDLSDIEKALAAADGLGGDIDVGDLDVGMDFSRDDDDDDTINEADMKDPAMLAMLNDIGAVPDEWKQPTVPKSLTKEDIFAMVKKLSSGGQEHKEHALILQTHEQRILSVRKMVITAKRSNPGQAKKFEEEVTRLEKQRKTLIVTAEELVKESESMNELAGMTKEEIEDMIALGWEPPKPKERPKPKAKPAAKAPPHVIELVSELTATNKPCAYEHVLALEANENACASAKARALEMHKKGDKPAALDAAKTMKQAEAERGTLVEAAKAYLDELAKEQQKQEAGGDVELTEEDMNDPDLLAALADLGGVPASAVEEQEAEDEVEVTEEDMQDPSLLAALAEIDNKKMPVSKPSTKNANPPSSPENKKMPVSKPSAKNVKPPSSPEDFVLVDPTEGGLADGKLKNKKQTGKMPVSLPPKPTPKQAAPTPASTPIAPAAEGVPAQAPVVKEQQASVPAPVAVHVPVESSAPPPEQPKQAAPSTPVTDAPRQSSTQKWDEHAKEVITLLEQRRQKAVSMQDTQSNEECKAAVAELEASLSNVVVLRQQATELKKSNQQLKMMKLLKECKAKEADLQVLIEKGGTTAKKEVMDMRVSPKVLELFKRYDADTMKWNLKQLNKCLVHCKGDLVTEDVWKQQCEAYGLDPTEGITVQVMEKYMAQHRNIDLDLKMSEMGMEIDAVIRKAIGLKNAGDLQGAKEYVVRKRSMEISRDNYYATEMAPEPEPEPLDPRTQEFFDRYDKKKTGHWNLNEVNLCAKHCGTDLITEAMYTEQCEAMGLDPALGFPDTVVCQGYMDGSADIERDIKLSDISLEIQQVVSKAIAFRDKGDIEAAKEVLGAKKKLEADKKAILENASTAVILKPEEEAQPVTQEAPKPPPLDPRIQGFFDRYDVSKTGHWNLQETNRCMKHLGTDPIDDASWREQCTQLGVDVAIGLPAAMVCQGYMDGSADIERDIKLSDLSTEIQKQVSKAIALREALDLDGAKAALRRKKELEAEKAALLTASTDAEPQPPQLDPRIQCFFDRYDVSKTGHWNIKEANRCAKHVGGPETGEATWAVQCRKLGVDPKVGLPAAVVCQGYVDGSANIERDIKLSDISFEIQKQVSKAIACREALDLDNAKEALKKKRELEAEKKEIMECKKN